MTRKLLSVIVALIMIGVVAGVVIISDFNDSYSDFEPITSVSGFVDSSNVFAFDVYRELADGEDNVFFSPYSVTTALSMAYEGARGQTALEMADVLGIPIDNRTRWDLMWSYQGYFNHESEYYDLSTANAYWLADNAGLTDDYRAALESYYLAHGEELDFAGDPEGSADAINAWIGDETNGKIEDMLSLDSINPATYMMLTNAIYFKSDWKYKFDPDKTRESTFTKSDGVGIETDMMVLPKSEDAKFNVSFNSEAGFLELPYKNGELTMNILLPFENNISSIEEKLDFAYINDLRENFTSRELNILLPKFKFELGYELNDELMNLGMTTAFSDAADFSGMTDSISLKIDNVMHRSFIEVNEKGTEAAAATVVSMAPTSAGTDFFFANHPFIFFIEHKATGQILFMGKVENPTA